MKASNHALPRRRQKEDWELEANTGTEKPEGISKMTFFDLQQLCNRRTFARRKPARVRRSGPALFL